MVRKFTWDGEKIKETLEEEPKKHSPKDILNGLDGVRGQIQQLKTAGEQLKQQTAANKTQIDSASKFQKELAAFEDKCVELQKAKIEFIIKQIHEECFEKAKKSSAITIAKSPDAYTEEGKKQLPFLDYQKLLATNEKMSENISNRMVREFLYETPVFENPFKV